MGRIGATTHPIVLLTSNNSRELTEALKRRCLYLWLDYPNDGRYLIQHHDADNFTVIPGPPTELQHRLARHIAIFTERRRR